MSVMKRVMLLLLLAAIGTNAAPGPENCDGLNITLPRKDLDKVSLLLVSSEPETVWSIPPEGTDLFTTK